MRIQHNIMAMNAYRNFSNNTSALSKNLEKLSSGYKINRAGDDAAGLAISEKMRAQITGLETAQKNAKDGISLIQTAEGALTEVHDMLNRMVELADQSANGTYDNETDRANLQKEFDALRTEIDRIADSSNFNGIKLLDGSLAATSKTTTGGVSGEAAALVSGAGVLGDGAAVAGEYTTTLQVGTAGAVAETEKVVDSATNTTGGVVKLALTANDGSTYELNFAVAADADLTVAGLRSALTAQLETGVSDEFKALNPDWEDFASKFTVDVGLQGNNPGEDKMGQISLKFTAKEAGADQPAITGIAMSFHKLDSATGDYIDTATGVGDANTALKTDGTYTGSVSTKTAATDAYKAITFADNNGDLNGKTVTIGDKTYQFVKANELGKVADGNQAVVLGDNKAETMANLVARLKDNGVTSASTYNTSAGDTVVRIGNTDEIKVATTQSFTASSDSKGITLGNDAAVNGKYTVTGTAITTAEDQTVTFNYKTADGTEKSYKLALDQSTIEGWDDGGSAPDATEVAKGLAEAINNDDTLKELFTAEVDSSNNLVLHAKNAADGVTLTSMSAATNDTNGGDTVFGNDAGTGVTVTVTGTAAGTTNVNGTKAYNAGQTIEIDNNKLQNGDTLEVNGKTYQFLTSSSLDDLQEGATAVIIGANSNETTANLKVALANDGITTKDPASNKLLIENNSEVTTKNGGLTLQIGDTSESFNKMTVSVNDMHAKALGLADLSIADQDSASDAVEAIKAAINSVSSTRGDLGAFQNRLEHTINNLSVMQENIQDAEATIRDTDVAAEMMEYTKNNILIQSAQAMLAQANQVPQGVLQLLQ